MKVNAECEVGCKHVSPVGMTEDRGQDRTGQDRKEQDRTGISPGQYVTKQPRRSATTTP